VVSLTEVFYVMVEYVAHSGVLISDHILFSVICV